MKKIFQLYVLLCCLVHKQHGHNQVQVGRVVLQVLQVLQVHLASAGAASGSSRCSSRSWCSSISSSSRWTCWSRCCWYSSSSSCSCSCGSSSYRRKNQLQQQLLHLQQPQQLELNKLILKVYVRVLKNHKLLFLWFFGIFFISLSFNCFSNENFSSVNSFMHRA